MKILLIGSNFPRSYDDPLVSGIVKNAFNHGRSLAELGVSVDVITDGGRGQWIFAGMHIYGIGAGLAKGVLRAAHLDVKVALKFMSLRKKEYDVIHVHTGNVVLLFLLKKIGLFSANIVYTAHGTTTPEIAASVHTKQSWRDKLVSVNGKIQEWIDRSMWKWSNSLISVSMFQLKEMRAIYGVAEDKIFQIYNGFDSERYYPDTVAGRARRYSLGISNSAPVVLYVGRAARKKGIDLLITAAPALVAIRPDISIVCVTGDMGKGFDAPYVREIYRLAQESTVSKNIRIVSNVSEANLPSFYQMANVAVFPSRHYESLPTVIYEAAACGLPVITPQAWGIPEVLSETLLSENSFQDTRLVDAIIEAIDSKAISRLLPSNDEYTWSSLAKKYLKLYESFGK